MKFKGFIIGMAITAGIVGAFDAGIAITRSLADNHYSQQLEVKDESLASYLEQLSTLQQQLDEALSNGETDAETISELQSQIATLKVEIQTLQAQLEKDPDKTYIDSLVNYKSFISLSNGNMLMTTNSGVYIVYKDYSIKMLTSGNWSTYNTKFIEINDKCVFVNAGISFKGVYVYDMKNDTLEMVYDTGYWYEIYKADSNYLIITTLNNQDYKTLVLNIETKEIKEFTIKCSTFILQKKNNDILFRDGKTLILYNSNTHDLEEIGDYETNGGAYIGEALELSNGDVIMGMENGKDGILLFDSDLKTISKIYEDTNNGYWEIFYETQNNKVLISTTRGSANILIYDINSKTIKDSNCSGSNMDTFVEDENGVTISSTKSDSKLYYSYETGECTKIS